KVHDLASPAAALRELAACPINENTPHRLRGGREEVSTIVESWRAGSHQAQPCFMNQRRWLQRMPGRFLCHFGGGQKAQFVVHEVEQLFRCLGLALFYCRQ